MMTAQEIAGFNLFTGLDETELSEIARICLRKTYEVNSIIFDPDTPSEELYLVEAGTDAIQIEIPLGTQKGKIVIHTISKGEAFGWAALGPQHVKTAIARCLDEVTLIAINVKTLLQILEINNHIGYIVMKNLSEIISMRLAYTTVAFRHEIRKNKTKPLMEKPSELSCECG
jgi:CRP/FNR family transcriptional regulator, cyclic AMP receptor protein